MTTTEVQFPRGRRLRVLEHRAQAHDFAEWERESTEAILDYLKPGMVVYDVGAEEGEFSALWASVVGPGNVHLFEPTPSVWPNIRACWEANFGDAKPGGTFCGFVSHGADIRGRHPHPGEGWPAATGGPLQRDSRFSVVIERPDLPVTTLDAYRSDFKMPAPDVIVCDVEGAELLVFHGAVNILSDARPEVFVSIHPADFLSRFPAPWPYIAGGGTPQCEQEHLFRLFANHGYRPTFIFTDHEAHWRFTPRERCR